MQLAVIFVCWLGSFVAPGFVDPKPGAVAPVGVARPGEAGPLHVTVGVALDPAYDADVTEAVFAAVADVAGAAGYAVVAGHGSETPQLNLKVRWENEPGGDIEVIYGFDRGDGPRRDRAWCRRCDASSLTSFIREDGDRLLPFLEPNPPATAEVLPPPRPTAASSAKPLRRSPRAGRAGRADGAGRAPLDRVGWAGVGTMLGAVLPTAAGVTLLAVGERSTAGELESVEVTDYRPAGYAVLGVAGASLITGAALLVVDRVRARRVRVGHVALGRRRGLGPAVVWSQRGPARPASEGM